MKVQLSCNGFAMGLVSPESGACCGVSVQSVKWSTESREKHCCETPRAEKVRHTRLLLAVSTPMRPGDWCARAGSRWPLT